MTIGRNAPCFCGSGRKYKVCCLKKQNVVEMRQLQEDRFFDRKHSLTVKMLDFLHSHLNIQQLASARSLFNQGLQYETSSKHRDYYNNFWLCYFYTFPNGLRGVEWFYQESKQLTANEREFLAKWVQMKPRLLQVTGAEPSGITTTDLITQETFFLPFCDSLKFVLPWGVAITMLEPFGDHYCIHGVSTFDHPKFATQLTEMIQTQIRETGKPYPELMQENYLKLMEYKLKGTVPTQELTGKREETSLIYQVLDFERAILFLQDENHGIYVDQAENNNVQFSLTGTWYEYKDSVFPGTVEVSDVLASIDLNKQELILKTTYPEIINTFLSSASRFPFILKYKEQRTKNIPLPANTMITTSSVRLEREDTPPWLPLYAQQLMHLKKGINEKVVNINDSGELERWLRESEYSIMKLAIESFPSFDHPFNPNPIRHKVGLPPSPFIPLERNSSFTVVNGGGHRIDVIPRDEIFYYQQIGLTPETAFTFYAADLVTFFKEKTDGKTEGTIKKYQWGLRVLAQYFQDMGEEKLESWEQCDPTFWDQLINGSYIAKQYQASMSQAKAIQSVLNQLSKWLEKRGIRHLPEYVETI